MSVHRGRHLTAAELERRDQIECAVARWWPDRDKIMAVAEATVPELRAVIQHMKLMNREPAPPKAAPPIDVLRAAHAAYVRGERSADIVAANRLWDLQYRRLYRERRKRLARLAA